MTPVTGAQLSALEVEVGGVTASAQVARPRVAGLRYTELAAALAASDMPTRRSVSREQALAFVMQGLERCGAEAIREFAEASLQIGQTLSRRERAYGRHWGSWRRADQAHGAAFLLLFPVDERGADR